MFASALLFITNVQLCNRRVVGQFFQAAFQFFFGEVVVLQLPVEVVVVGLQVEMAVTTEVEENGFAFARFFAQLRFADGLRYCVVGFRCRDDAFCFGKLNACFEAFQLLQRIGFNQTVFE